MVVGDVSGRGLIDLLRRAHLPVERAWAARACSHPGVLWDGVEEALQQAKIPAPQLRVGDPLLLAFSPASGAAPAFGSLWRIVRPEDADPPEDAVTLSPQAREAWARALRVANRSLPLLSDPSCLSGALPQVIRLDWAGRARLHSFDGPSAGLSFALAHTSDVTGCPIPADLACSAAVADDGQLCPVDGLPEKLRALEGWAPGVRRVIVASDQPMEGCPVGFHILRARDVREAIDHTFDPSQLAAFARMQWISQPELAADAADSFFALALTGPPSAVCWSAAARAADILAAALPAIDRLPGSRDAEIRWRAEFARAVMARHSGDPRPVPEPPPDLRLRRPFRLELLAHRVQTCADEAGEGWEALLAGALATVAASHEEHPEDLKLLGAIGRLQAARGRWQEAAHNLLRAVHGWFDLDRAPEASHALCELSRISGLCPDLSLDTEISPAVTRVLAHPRTPQISRAYLHLACGRAAITRGSPLGSCGTADLLSDDAFPWEDAPVDVRASRLRWRTRLPGCVDALDELKRLVQHARESVRTFWYLARADSGEAAALRNLRSGDRKRFDLGLLIEPSASLRRQLDLFPY